MPQETKSKFQAGAASVPSPAPASLQGLVATSADEAELVRALEQAFDYRGDVTITHVDGRAIEGYIFDRRRGQGLSDSTVRLMLPATGEKVTVAFSQIERLEFTGRDTAAGKSFETWLKKYVDKKLAGEKASIESEALD